MFISAMHLNHATKIIVQGAANSGAGVLARALHASAKESTDTYGELTKSQKNKWKAYRVISVVRNPLERFCHCVLDYAEEKDVSVDEAVKFLIGLLVGGDESTLHPSLLPQSKFIAEEGALILPYSSLHVYCNKTQAGVVPPKPKVHGLPSLSAKRKEIVKRFYAGDYALMQLTAVWTAYDGVSVNVDGKPLDK